MIFDFVERFISFGSPIRQTGQEVRSVSKVIDGASERQDSTSTRKSSILSKEHYEKKVIEEIVQLLIPEEGNFSLQGATATCHRLFISGEQKTERTYLKSLPTLISNVTNDGKYLTKKQ